MISATDPAAVLLGDLCVHRSAMDDLYVHRSAMDELRHIIAAMRIMRPPSNSRHFSGCMKEPLVNRFISVPIMLYLRGISARDLNHIVVQDDRNAARHLSDEDERIGERIIASVALAVAPISDSPKPPPCRDIVAGIFDADKDVADKDDADKDVADKDDADKDVADKDVADKDDADEDDAGADYPAANSWSGRQRS